MKPCLDLGGNKRCYRILRTNISSCITLNLQSNTGSALTELAIVLVVTLILCTGIVNISSTVSQLSYFSQAAFEVALLGGSTLKDQGIGAMQARLGQYYSLMPSAGRNLTEEMEIVAPDQAYYGTEKVDLTIKTKMKSHLGFAPLTVNTHMSSSYMLIETSVNNATISFANPAKPVCCNNGICTELPPNQTYCSSESNPIVDLCSNCPNNPPPGDPHCHPLCVPPPLGY